MTGRIAHVAVGDAEYIDRAVKDHGQIHIEIICYIAQVFSLNIEHVSLNDAGWADKIHGLTIPADGPYHVQTLQNQLVFLDRLFHETFLFLCLLGKLGLHLHVVGYCLF